MTRFAVVLAVLLFPLSALAQVPPTMPAVTPPINWTEVVMAIITAVLPLFLAGLTWVSKLLVNLIAQKVKNEEVKGILQRLDTISFDVVKELMQVSVDAAKKAADDGKVPKEVAEAAGKAALDKIKSYLGPDGLEKLKAILGFNTDPATADAKLDSFLTTKIEATVHSVKMEKAASVSAAAATSAVAAAFK